MKLLVDSSVFVDAFDPSSPNHADALFFLEHIHKKGIVMTMPAHAWFEVECTLRKLIEEKRFSGPTFNGQMRYPVELIHIDDQFITDYRMVDIPYIKAGDHIFLVVAKKNDYPLVTSDEKMLRIGRRSGVRVFEPNEIKIE